MTGFTDPKSFLDATFTEANSTERTPIPEGDFQATILDIDLKNGQNKEGKAWMRGLKPTGRLRTCQPLIWKMRCTVFLLNPSRCATVR